MAYTMKVRNLELAILTAVARVRNDEWLPCSFGDLQNRLRDVDPDAGNESVHSIAEAAIFLNQDGHLLLSKREEGVGRRAFNLQKQFDDGYIANFFCRGSFELRVTHKGRKHLEESEQSRGSIEPRKETVCAQKSAEVQRRDLATSKESNWPKEETPQGTDAVSALEDRLPEVVKDPIDPPTPGRTPVSAPKGARPKMARTATVLNVLIASPSDVREERNVVTDVIHGWNAAHYETTGIMLHPVRWESHSYPASGNRPQAILNKQVVDSGDILIGIFGHRLGTPTGTAQSGTIEEIEEFRKAGKYVALYFSKADVPRSADRDQLKALEDYHRERQKDTLYGTFGTPAELRLLVTQHLPKIVAEVCPNLKGPASATGLGQVHSGDGARVAFSQTNDELSPKEIELLWNAARDSEGEILYTRTLDGESIRTHGRQFLEDAGARAGAEWVEAFGSLQNRGLIEPLGSGSDFYRVTGDGYRAADELNGFARWDAQSILLRARYMNAPDDKVTLTCKSIIAIPPRYFEDQIGADGSVQRSLKEPATLIVEEIGPQPALSWSPTEVEFLDGESGRPQKFQVSGMEFFRPGSLKLLIDA